MAAWDWWSDGSWLLLFHRLVAAAITSPTCFYVSHEPPLIYSIYLTPNLYPENLLNSNISVSICTPLPAPLPTNYHSLKANAILLRWKPVACNESASDWSSSYKQPEPPLWGTLNTSVKDDTRNSNALFSCARFSIFSLDESTPQGKIPQRTGLNGVTGHRTDSLPGANVTWAWPQPMSEGQHHAAGLQDQRETSHEDFLPQTITEKH